MNALHRAPLPRPVPVRAMAVTPQRPMGRVLQTGKAPAQMSLFLRPVAAR